MFFASFYHYAEHLREFEDAPCLCTLFTSVVAAIVPVCFVGLYAGNPYILLI